MRIGLVYQHFLLDGSLPRFHVELTRQLLANGHQVHVFSADSGIERSLAPDAVFHPVASHPYGKSRIGEARAVWSFAREATRTVAAAAAQIDLLHSRGPALIPAPILHLPGVIDGEAARFRATRPHASPRDALFSLVRPIAPVRRRLERAAIPAARQIHVDSEFVRQDVLAHYQVDPDRVIVMPPGVDLTEFHPGDKVAERAGLELPDGPLILFCANAPEHKGLDRLLAAHALMHVRATLLVVGVAGDDRDGVRFFGFRYDIASFYRAADVYAIPSRYDIWGATVIEAMASGLSVVTSGAGGSARTIRNGETGFVLQDADSATELAGLLDLLLSDPDLRARVGGAAFKVAAGMSWSEYARRFEEIVAIDM